MTTPEIPGVSLCTITLLPCLLLDALNVVLFHHEKESASVLLVWSSKDM